MMKHIKFFICFLLIINSCNNDKLLIKNETEILSDILNQIITDKYFFPITPPPPLIIQTISNKNNTSEYLETIDSADNYSKEYIKFYAKLDTSRFVISIEDSTENFIDKSLINANLKDKGYNDLLFNKRLNKHKLPIFVDQIKNTGKYQLIKRSMQFPKGFNFRTYKGFDLHYYYFGNMTFSQAFLDDSQVYGYILYKRDCGFECDQEYILIIRKQDNRWIIKEKITPANTAYAP